MNWSRPPMTDQYPEPDPGRYPVWPRGDWRRALICQVAGVPVDPATARALSRHDAQRGESRNTRLRAHAAYLRDLRTDLAPVLRNTLEVPVMGLDWFAMAVEDATGWEGRGDDVRAAVLGQFPVTEGALDGEESPSAGASGLRRYYAADAGDHLVTTSASAVRRWRAGRSPVDPLDPPAEVLESITHAVAKVSPPRRPGAPEDGPGDAGESPVAEVIPLRPQGPQGPLRSQGVRLDPEQHQAAVTRAVDLRETRGWTLAAIARDAGVDRTTVRQWLRKAE